MEPILIIIISLYVTIYIWNRVETNSAKHILLKSDVDGNYYYVQKKYHDSQKACDLLAQIKIRLEKLIQHLEKKYPDDSRVLRILSQFDSTNLVENDNNMNVTSYTQNKGEKMVFCLRTRNDTAQLHSINLLMFVAIHELAHVCSVSVGHQSEFWNNFSFLLKEALDAGVWKYIDFKNNPAQYCGTKITNSVI
jgi:hypothetical protein